MSSAFSWVQGAGYSRADSSGTRSSGTLSGTRTARRSCASESPTVFWTPPLSAEISEPSSGTATPGRIRAWLISLQPASPASPSASLGEDSGGGDERNRWPETIQTIRIVRPSYAFLENTPGLLTSEYFGTVLRDLHEEGYDAQWCVLGADDCGAPHRRKRLWILAYAHGLGLVRRIKRVPSDPGNGPARRRKADSHERSWWEDEPGVGRVADGIPHRLDRLRALGNGQVPMVAETAFRLLMGSRGAGESRRRY